jgi:hypothetical protein
MCLILIFYRILLNSLTGWAENGGALIGFVLRRTRMILEMVITETRNKRGARNKYWFEECRLLGCGAV